MQVYVVGGAVRDELMGKKPKDFDYVVVGSSQQAMLDAGYKQVGLDFPVFLHPETNDEYALARVERKTGKGYNGFAVETEGVTLEDDLGRRDLTINSMARSSEGELVDPHDGRGDLRRKILRHTSNAFSEDPLRVIRLARFYARYDDFTVAPETERLAVEMAERGQLDEIPAERFWAEWRKVFEERSPERFFEFLSRIRAPQHIKFVQNTYGDFTSEKLRFMKKTAALEREMEPDFRMMIHTAVNARPDAIFIAAVSRMVTLHKNLQVLRAMTGKPATVDGVFNLLKQTKAWGVGDAPTDLLMAMTTATLAGERFAIGIACFLMCLESTRKVKSENFGLPPGKELGEAIEQARKNAIRIVFSQIGVAN